MSLTDPVADTLINLKNHEMASKKQCMFRPASKLITEILKILLKKGFIQKYELIDDGRDGMFKVELNGKINECRAIKPRYSVKKNEYEKYEKRFLPAKDIGILIVSTPKGVMLHQEAKKQGIGGRLIAFVY